MTTQFAISADGTRIAYDVTGHGSALMLLHGAGKTRQDWHTVGYVGRLQEDFTVIAVDLRGTGESDILTEIADYTVEKMCADLNAVAEACQVEQVAIWGFSFGGNVARYLAARTDRVAALAVIGVPLGPVADDKFARFTDDFVKKWGPSVKASQGDKPAKEKQKAALKGGIPVWLACFQAMLDWPTVKLEDIRCPVLLLAGTENKGVIEWIQSNQKALDRAGVQVKVVEGLNHNQEFSEIDRVFPIVRPFFSSQGRV